MGKLIVIVLGLFAVGCTKDPEATLPSSNREFKVDRLFTHEGVTLYRFQDGGRNIYYAVPYKGPIELTEFHSECQTSSEGKETTTRCDDVQQSTFTLRN